MRQYVSAVGQNPVLALRTPDQAAVEPEGVEAAIRAQQEFETPMIKSLVNSRQGFFISLAVE